MYKDFSTDEKIVLIFISVFSIGYRICKDCKICDIDPKIIIILLIFSAGYIWFNRTIKMLINLIRNYRNFYDTEFIVQDILYKPAGHTSYPVYIAEYTGRDDKTHTKEIHSSFSIKKWKKGDIIKIKADSKDPENIIIPFSDFSMAVIMSVIGIITEIILITIYTHINI